MRHLNPFYLLGKQVFPELVLLVRLLAVYLIWSGESPFMGNQGSGRFHPVVALLGQIGTDDQFNSCMLFCFFCGLLILLFSSWVRTGSFLAGSVFLIGMLSCQTCISVAHMFTACLFVCTSLSNHETGTTLIRLQLIVLYLGADLNKITDADWWSGAAIETLLATKHQIPAYLAVSNLFPSMLLSQMLGVGVIILQFTIAIFLLKKSLTQYAVLAALLLHLPMVLLMQMTFGPFLMALVLAYGSLLQWPRTLTYDALNHSPLLVTLLKFFDFNDQVQMDFEKGSPESLVKFFRTMLYFLPHPAILLFCVGLSAGLIHYGKLFPLGILVIFLFCTNVWIPLSRKKPESPALVPFS